MDESKPTTTPTAKPARRQPSGNREPPLSLDAALAQMLLPLRRSLTGIEKHLSQAADAADTRESTSDSFGTSDHGLIAVINDRFDQLSTEIGGFFERTIMLIESQTPLLDAVPVPDADADILASNTLVDSTWSEIILGKDLCDDDAIAAVRAQLLEDVLAGNTAARAFAGQLLLAQSAIADEFPNRLRHIGEAFYRWRPRTSTEDDPFEQSLADSLTRRAEAAGLPNVVQLVLPGTRYDKSRHTAPDDGVEIVAVHGWIVLRDHRKVYTRASVTAR